MFSLGTQLINILEFKVKKYWKTMKMMRFSCTKIQKVCKKGIKTVSASLLVQVKVFMPKTKKSNPINSEFLYNGIKTRCLFSYRMFGANCDLFIPESKIVGVKNDNVTIIAEQNN